MSLDPPPERISVLLVCLGNICRSPMAEAVLAHRASLRPHLVEKYEIKVDSCGTAAYHVGEEPDERTVATCQKHGVPIDSLARALSPADFRNFSHVIAMDRNNLRNCLNARPAGSPARVSLFSDYAPAGARHVPGPGKDVSDPYYGGLPGFDRVYAQCVAYSEGFLDRLERGDMEGIGLIEDKGGKRQAARSGM